MGMKVEAKTCIGGATAIIQNRDDGSWTRVASSGHGEKWSQYVYFDGKANRTCQWKIHAVGGGVI